MPPGVALHPPVASANVQRVRLRRKNVVNRRMAESMPAGQARYPCSPMDISMRWLNLYLSPSDLTPEEACQEILLHLEREGYVG